MELQIQSFFIEIISLTFGPKLAWIPRSLYTLEKSGTELWKTMAQTQRMSAMYALFADINMAVIFEHLLLSLLQMPLDFAYSVAE